MERAAPPIFKQGPSAQLRLVFFSALAICLLMVDVRFQTLDFLRKGVAVVIYPLQRLMLVPRDASLQFSDYFQTLSTTQRENEALRRSRIESAQLTTQAQQLMTENVQLRQLLGARERAQAPAVLVEVLYEARDAFTHRLVVDKGSLHGIRAGQPVIDDGGVVGQVTRVTPISSEIALLTDRDQTIPVQVLRHGLRAIAFGGEAPGRLGLRYMASNVDLKPGDVLLTSGIDGIYPPGLPVAVVEHIERDAAYGFARVICKPSAGLDRHRHFLVLLVAIPDLPMLPSVSDALRNHRQRGTRP